MDTTTSSPKTFGSPKTSGLTASSSKQYRSLGVALAVTAGLWLTTVGAGIAQADTPPLVETKSQQVTFDDLNLSSESGARTLLVRINQAARAACGRSTHSPLLPREAAHRRACVTEAVDAAVKRVDLPVLTALHTGATADIAVAAR
jgi:UrcA family protein